jgi:malate dehydrogenase
MAKRVCVAGATGEVGYSLLPMIADGDMLGSETSVTLVLLDLPFAAQALEGIRMEIEDSRFPLVASVETTTSVIEATRDLDYAVLLTSFPDADAEAETEERARQRTEANVGIFKVWGEALNRFARKTVRVCVVGPPAMTNALIVGEYAPTIPRRNITALSRWCHNVTVSVVAEKLNCNVGNVQNVVVWGNHISTPYADVSHAEVRGRGTVRELANDMNWTEMELPAAIRKRADEVVGARADAPGFSVARAACMHFRDLECGTPAGTFVSMGVFTERGRYGIADGIVFSLPCISDGDGEWRVVSNLVLSESQMAMLRVSEAELIADAERVYELVDGKPRRGPRPLSAAARANPSQEDRDTLIAQRRSEAAERDAEDAHMVGYSPNQKEDSSIYR